MGLEIDQRDTYTNSHARGLHLEALSSPANTVARVQFEEFLSGRSRHVLTASGRIVEHSLIRYHEAFDNSTTALLNDLQHISWDEGVETSRPRPARSNQCLW